jgi:hypothetical protein
MEQYLKSAIKQFEYYKGVAEKAMAQLNDADLFWQANEECNSIATIVQHIHGNMLSRWTDFFTTDGEKEWRNRDAEFEPVLNTREQLMQKWNEGWACLFNALDTINESNWHTTIYIRNEPHTVVDAVNRQLAHIPYHIGQIVFIGKMRAQAWTALTIPKGASKAFNAQMFNNPTDQFSK